MLLTTVVGERLNDVKLGVEVRVKVVVGAKKTRRLLGLNAEGANAETGVPWRWV